MVKDSVSTGNRKQALKDIADLDTQIKNCIERVKKHCGQPAAAQFGSNYAGRCRAGTAQPYDAQYKNIKHTFTVQTDDGTAVSDEVKIVLYRVAQESLNNVIKHSGADARGRKH